MADIEGKGEFDIWVMFGDFLNRFILILNLFDVIFQISDPFQRYGCIKDPVPDLLIDLEHQDHNFRDLAQIYIRR